MLDDTDTLGYKRAITLLDAEVDRLKKESQAKSIHIQKLKSRLSAVRPNSNEIYSLETAESLKKALLTAEQEIQRLKNVNSDAELRFQTAQAQITSLSQRLSNRDSVSNPLYSVLSCFQRENKVLKDEIHRLQEQIISQDSFHALEREMKEVEDTHHRLEVENREAKRRVEELEEKRKREDLRLVEIGGSLSDRRREVCQLAELVRIITQGGGVSATLLLGARLSSVSPVPSSTPIDYLSQVTTQLQQEITGLRQLLADVYAEQSGALCGPQ